MSKGCSDPNVSVIPFLDAVPRGERPRLLTGAHEPSPALNRCAHAQLLTQARSAVDAPCFLADKLPGLDPAITPAGDVERERSVLEAVADRVADDGIGDDLRPVSQVAAL